MAAPCWRHPQQTNGARGRGGLQMGRVTRSVRPTVPHLMERASENWIDVIQGLQTSCRYLLVEIEITRAAVRKAGWQTFIDCDVSELAGSGLAVANARPGINNAGPAVQESVQMQGGMA